MSKSNIRRWFPFVDFRVIEIIVNETGQETQVVVVPNKRYAARCSKCLKKRSNIHSHHIRYIYDLPIAESVVKLEIHYRKVLCPSCGIRIEHIDFVEPYGHVTKRFAQYIASLCKVMTIRDVAQHVKLSWYQVKEIDKAHLEAHYENVPIDMLRILSVDEIAIKKRHQYMTVILNYETGTILRMNKDRKTESLGDFFKSLPEATLAGIEAIAIDMWDPYIKATKNHCSHAAIVFDLFHVVAAFNRVIDKVRNEEINKLTKKDKLLFKKSKYLFLKNPENLDAKERPRLKDLLRMNETLSTVYILKEHIKRLWNYRYKKSAEDFLNYWCSLAYETGVQSVIKFANMLTKYSYGILNHCLYPIHTGKLEGVNNKIKVIKRKAYGFRDLKYFELKCIQATY